MKNASKYIKMGNHIGKSSKWWSQIRVSMLKFGCWYHRCCTGPVGPTTSGAPLIPDKAGLPETSKLHRKKKWTIANTADSQYKFEGEFLWNRWDAKVRDTNWWVQNTTLVDVPLPWRSAKSDNVRPIRALLGANVDTRRFNWLSSKVRFLSSGSDGKSPGFTDVG